jgi:hypothetical protein
MTSLAPGHKVSLQGTDYMIIATLTSRHAHAYIGIRGGGAMATALLIPGDTAWKVTHLSPMPLLDMLRHVLAKNTGWRLAAWDLDYIPILGERDLELEAVG